MDENIFLDIDNNINETESSNDINLSDEITQMLNEVKNLDSKFSSDIYNKAILDKTVFNVIDYTFNYKIKDLHLICDYYNFLKEVKQNKYNKEQIINKIVEFENDVNNSEIVCKRMNMWFHMNELKNDKFMRKFILF